MGEPLLALGKPRRRARQVDARGEIRPHRVQMGAERLGCSLQCLIEAFAMPSSSSGDSPLSMSSSSTSMRPSAGTGFISALVGQTSLALDAEVLVELGVEGQVGVHQLLELFHRALGRDVAKPS